MIKSVADANIRDKSVLLRVDFNVPLGKDNSIEDDTRIQAVLPTIKYLLENGASRVIILTHIGRPSGYDKLLSTEVVAIRLSELLNEDVEFVDECAEASITTSRRVVVLQNTRFYEGEKKCDSDFAAKISQLGDLYVSDAFAVCHRAEASITTLPEYMKSQGKDVYAGLLLMREVEILDKALKNATKPFTLIISGAKIDTKIGLIENFYDKVSTFVLGGGIANTFLKALGYEVGTSLCENEQLELAQKILQNCKKHGCEVVLPVDAVISNQISEEAVTSIVDINSVPSDMKILDIGPKTIDKIDQVLKSSATVVWNGPLGVYEFGPFKTGTLDTANNLANLPAVVSIIGGGDTIDAINKFNIPFAKFTHVSTGGGAMVEYLEGKPLPGIDALR